MSEIITLTGIAWLVEADVRSAITRAVAPPLSVRANRPECVLVEPAAYLWDDTASFLRSEGFTVIEESLGGYLRILREPAGDS